MLKKITFTILALCSFILFITSCSKKRSGEPRVLVFCKTAGFHHSSIPVGLKAIQDLGATNGFDVDSTTDAAMFNEDTLKKYSALIFLNSTGDLLSGNQETALERYIQAGGGFVGIHAASDAEYDWGWYGRMIGAYFMSHPHIQQAKLVIKDKNHPSTDSLPDTWTRTDEWYNFKKISKDIKVLMTIDEKSYEGGKNGDDHPMAWYHEFDGGRVFYTELGHTEESYAEPLYLKHILGGIKYAIGDNKVLDYAKAHSEFAPDEDRFTKTQLVQGTFFEPTELTILPNLDILVTQRRGEIMMYSNETKKVKQVGFLDVYYKTLHTPNVNAEEGLLGIKADPDFAKNHWVYIFYSPSDTSVNRLSRFTLEKDTLDPKSEKIILQFYEQREICCHTGGSIAFGPDKDLFVSTGDNTTPFDEPNQPFVSHGFAPLDDRPGHFQYDDRRGSGNTNDLRGKILRIKVKDDGTYDIPDGNLFPKGTEKTRPEIYVMGTRNPYRIAVDQKNGFLYWGEVGPDASEDSFDTRGPRGYDEVNQARKAGNFGYPLFIGPNYPYRRYDYATGKSGELFDPAKPVNESRNNTGLRDLPPAQPAFIWYPYANSPDFPSVGSGGRCAMAGPVYYSDLYPKETRYPSYYDGKFIFYEWERGFIKAVTMLPNGDYDKMEPFIPNIKLNSPIDIEVGPDGRLYALEYGTGWFQKNPDAGIARIDYNGGNRPPKVSSITIDKETGDLPFTVKAKVEARDPEKQPMKFSWHFGDGSTVETTTPDATFTYQKAGDYKIYVDVKDAEGAVVKSDELNVYAGNEQPTVNINITGNKSFYFPGKDVRYTVSVEDKDDTASAKQMSGLYVSADYLEGHDKAAIVGHLQAAAEPAGKTLMMNNDCKTCHKIDEKSIGPAFMQVSEKYPNNQKSVDYLINKIKKGGGGVWGETMMAAHPDIKDADVTTIVQWILGLHQKTPVKPSLASSGSLKPSLGKPINDKAALIISASYTDKGGAGIKPLTGNATTVLHSANMNFNGVKRMKGFDTDDDKGVHYMTTTKTEGWFSVDHIDLTGITGASLLIGYEKSPVYGYTFEIRLDAPDGKLLGTAEVLPNPKAIDKKMNFVTLNYTFSQAVTDGQFHDLYIFARPKDEKEKEEMKLGALKFETK
ncbi:MAG: ThuA domain-containing protein [Bacteroidetes bacterium]|nr:ThuA domain-containing protein [Bacteroidota bacterium]